MRDAIVYRDAVTLYNHILVVLLVGFMCSVPVVILAATPITPSGLNTQVNLAPSSPPGKVQFDITGGTRPGGGVNLFHSFGQFNVPNNNIANFLNETGLPTSNILGRVTGGNISSILGTIQTTGFGNANLFLINPAGFLFGPNATVNVGGMVSFTSADYLRLADGVRFNAVPDPAADALLSTAPVAAYGFLGSTPGAITVQGSQFTVTEGTGISLIGGNVTIESGTPDGGTAQPARLLAPNGKLQLATTASPGEFDAATLQSLPSLDAASFTSFGSVSLAPGSSINISGPNKVSIQSGQFVLSVNDAVLSTSNNAGASETISLSPNSSIVSSNSVSTTGADVEVVATSLKMDRSTIQSLTTSEGSGGEISVTSQSITLTNGGQIVSNSQGTGRGGAITMVATNSIAIAGVDPDNRPQGMVTDLGLVASGVYSVTQGGQGGEITVTTPHLVISDIGRIATSTLGDGVGGDINIHSSTLTLTAGARLLSSSGIDFKSFSIGGTGAGGNINISDVESLTVSGRDAAENPSRIRTENWGAGKGGDITINSTPATVSLAGLATIETFSLGEAPAGNVLIEASVLNVSGGAGIATSGSDIASSGNLDITAHTNIHLSGFFNGDIPSRITNENPGFGGTGTTTISTGTLTLDNGARILSDTFFDLSSPVIPKISITADSINLSNSRIDVRNILTDVGALSISSPTILLSNQSAISTLTAADGNAGPINLSTQNLSLSEGSQVVSSTSGAGGAGKVTIQGLGGEGTSAASVTIAGQDGSGNASGVFTTTSVMGSGGDIAISTQSFAMQDRSTLSANTSGSGNAGNILVKANDVMINSGATITTASTGSGNAGSVTVQGLASPAHSVLIDGSGSGVFTDTQGTGAGGNIFVNADTVTLSNGGMLSATTSGSESTATGGTITVTGNQIELLGESIITTQTFGPGSAGQISMTGDSIHLNTGFIFADTFGDGNAGSINLQARTMSLEESVIGSSAFEGSSGNAGSIHIRTTESLSLSDSGINSFSDQRTLGDSGQIFLTSPSINMDASTLTTTSLGHGNAGAITLETNFLTMTNTGSINSSTGGEGNGGTIVVRGYDGEGSRSQLISIANASEILTESINSAHNVPGQGNAGNISLMANELSLANNSRISAETRFSRGHAGNINLDLNQMTIASNSEISSRSMEGVAPAFQYGNAGAINLRADNGTVTGGGFISTSTETNGNAGNIVLKVGSLSIADGGSITSSSEVGAGGIIPSGSAGNVTIAGYNSPAESILINGSGSGIFTETQGTGVGGNISAWSNQLQISNGGTISSKTSGPGNAGDILVRANDITISGGATITAASTGSGNAGTVTIQGANSPANSFLVDGIGSGVFSNTESSGAGGSITIDSNAVTMTNGAAISANSAGGADAGSINIMANNGLSMQSGSSITTEAGKGAGGGNIKITTSPAATVYLQNSTISASVGDGPGGGGNISIDPQYVILQNGRILATAADGAGGSISIVAGLFLPDSTSVVSADSGSGVNGTVTIQSPISQAGGKIQPLGKSPLLSTTMFNQRCAALAGGNFSSFTVGGRDTVPSEPGSWLSSPLALATLSEDKTIEATAEDDTPLLSLRQIAPPGFLTQVFAINKSDGCSSSG